MTEAEKKMKQYVNKVERKLNLPRDIKARVMSDFSSSIAARREAGLTDEEIYAELGSPKEAAAALNEQMKEFTYRKSPWRFLFGALAVYGVAELLGQLFGKVLFAVSFPQLNQSSSVGIIGGADGPTAIFVTTAIRPVQYDLAMAALVILGLWGFFRLKKCKQK